MRKSNNLQNAVKLLIEVQSRDLKDLNKCTETVIFCINSSQIFTDIYKTRSLYANYTPLFSPAVA